MPETVTAREMARIASEHFQSNESPVEVAQAAALVAIALHLTEPAPDITPAPAGPYFSDTGSYASWLCPECGDSLFTYGEDFAGFAAHVKAHGFRHPAPGATLAGKDEPTTHTPGEARQPTGLNRIADAAATLDLPPEVSVEPASWAVSNHSRRMVYFVTKQHDGTYFEGATASTFPTLAEAVAAILRIDAEQERELRLIASNELARRVLARAHDARLARRKTVRVADLLGEASE